METIEIIREKILSREKLIRNDTGEKNDIFGCQVADNEQYSENSRATELCD